MITKKVNTDKISSAIKKNLETINMPTFWLKLYLKPSPTPFCIYDINSCYRKDNFWYTFFIDER